MIFERIEQHRDEITKKLNQIAKNTGLHSLLVMESKLTKMVVFAANDQDVYSIGDQGYKSNQEGHNELYCERVVSTNSPLLVYDAKMEPEWENNEDLVKFGLGTYYGIPIYFNDTAIGTVCALNKTPIDFYSGFPSPADQLKYLKSEIEMMLIKG